MHVNRLLEHLTHSIELLDKCRLNNGILHRLTLEVQN